jgi:hypothetical protein
MVCQRGRHRVTGNGVIGGLEAESDMPESAGFRRVLLPGAIIATNRAASSVRAKKKLPGIAAGELK